jgi:hypothetical protein
MWRRLWPVALLAVALQLVLPVAMLRAVAAGLDPLGSVMVCVADPADQPASGDGVPRHTHACPLCPAAPTDQVGLTQAAPGAPMPRSLAVAAVADPARSPGPRGPPTLWPPSRGPPAVS